MSSPFKFLDAYTKEDKDIFFGRSLEIKALFEKIHNGRLLLIYGASGTGKTSLIQCGLANQFQDTDWFPIVIRRNQNIHESTLLSVKENALTPIEKLNNSSNENILNGFESLYLDFYKPIFLIYDQFEELFISGDDDEILSFFELLNEILNSNIQIKVILIIREEYLAQLTNMEYVVPEIFNNRQRVEPMSMINIHEVIINSCETFNVNLENETTPKLIYEKLIGDNGRVELTHLQVFLDRLYKLIIKDDIQDITISNSLVSNVGKLEDVLATFLSEQVRSLSNPKLGWQVLKLFITEKGTKKSLSYKNLSVLFKKENINEIDGLKIINHFTISRVLRLIGKNNNYEFSHDSLALRVFDRLSIKEKSLLEIKQFINQEYSNYKTRNVLLSKEDLEYINPYLEDIDITDNQKLLIIKSKKELSKKKKQLIIIAIGIIFLLTTLSIFSLIKLSESEEAKKEAVIAYENLKLKEAEKEKAEKEKKDIEAKNLINYTNEVLQNAQHVENNSDWKAKEIAQQMINKVKDTLANYPNNSRLKKKLDEILKKYPDYD